MAKFDHRFWEIQVDPSVLESALTEPDFLQKLLEHGTTEKNLDLQESHTKKIVGDIQSIISTRLTPKQREIVDMYFFRGMKQQEIAAELCLPQQVVSKHLFGVMRNGRKVGGAITKIRKYCNRLGIEPKVGVKKS
jgi:RNA polymerase sigma factor (sigma-70 family)